MTLSLANNAMEVRFGVCASLDQATAVAEAGYDYIECAASSTLQADDAGSDFASILATFRQSPLPVEAFNLFLPSGMKIVGPELDENRIDRYLQRVFDRAGQAGAKVIVFGSGGARNVPDGFSREEAEAQIVRFLQQAAPFAGEHGVTLAIESLNQGESNIINSVPEAVDLAKRADHPAIRALADLYHITVEEEPLQNVTDAGRMLAHVHVADTGRLSPGTGQYDTTGLFRRLKQIGYRSRVSIECTWNDFVTEGPASLAFLRETWLRA